MQPTIGRVVHYQLNAADADAINRRRADHEAYRRTAAAVPAGEPGSLASGHVGHVGNHAAEGDICPAVVVRTWGSTPATSSANLQVLLDGNDSYWATSRCEGDGPGRWVWPPYDAQVPVLAPTDDSWIEMTDRRAGPPA